MEICLIAHPDNSFLKESLSISVSVCVCVCVCVLIQPDCIRTLEEGKRDNWKAHVE